MKRKGDVSKNTIAYVAREIKTSCPIVLDMCGHGIMNIPSTFSLKLDYKYVCTTYTYCTHCIHCIYIPLQRKYWLESSVVFSTGAVALFITVIPGNM